MKSVIIKELTKAHKVSRKLPANYIEEDRPYFEIEFSKKIQGSNLLFFKNINANDDGLLFKGYHILKEDFVNAEIANQYINLTHILKVVVKNYFFRKRKIINKPAVWFIDTWSYDYFHWITDVLARLFIARELENDYVYILPQRYYTKDYIKSSLKVFDIKEILPIPENIYFKIRKLYIPTQTALIGNYNESIIRQVRDLYRGYYKDRTLVNNKKYERIYISREKARLRKVINEDEVIDCLKKYGFEMIYFEDYPWEEQVVISMNVKIMISIHGAGLTNMLFMEEGNFVYEFREKFDTHFNCYYSLASALNLNYYYQRCDYDPKTKHPHLNEADLYIDIENLKQTVENIINRDIKITIK